LPAVDSGSATYYEFLMGKDRLAAFSDGVIAILITIMVLELRVPRGADWHALSAVVPAFST